MSVLNLPVCLLFINIIKIPVDPHLYPIEQDLCSFERGSVEDINGNRYRTLKAGDQEWMLEDLKVTHYKRDGLLEVN
ncbi:MAG: hypothetical protein IPH77_11950 [Ignavibacteria bacterium]|nr:hypothetical protein [Ignavibacteria bacterium]